MSALADVLAHRPRPPRHPALDAVIGDLRARYGDAVEAVLYYGSCLRQGDPTEGVIDLYVVVRDYRAAYRTLGRRLLAAFLPPTVGYLETPWEAGCIRTKYAVISLADFRRGTSKRWFHSYLWGRFAQPCVTLYTSAPEVASVLDECLARAVATLLDRTVALAPARTTSAGLWAAALGASYRAELRPEAAGRAEEIVAADVPHYDALTRAWAATGARGRLTPAADGGWNVAVSARGRRRCRGAWFLRRLFGKGLSAARWFKAAATFEGGLDYAVWKLERHTGRKIEIPERVRRRPWLYAWGEIIRLYRSGTLR